MDYTWHYQNLITRAKKRTKPEITERHHIIPRSIGGSNEKENLVYLTPEEHFVAHQLLVKVYPEHSFQLTYALNMMTVDSPTTPRSNKRYGWIKRRYIVECKKRIGSNNPSFGRRWYYDPDTFESRKFKPEEVPNTWLPGRIINKDKRVKFCDRCKIEEVQTKTGKLCFECRKSQRQNHGSKYIHKATAARIKCSESEIIKMLKISKTIDECCRKLGLKNYGNSYYRVKRIANENDLL